MYKCSSNKDTSLSAGRTQSAKVTLSAFFNFKVTSIMEINFKRVLSILLISILLGFSYNYFSAKGLGLFDYDNKKLLSAELLEGSDNEPKQIHIDEAIKLFEAGVIFMDAREAEEFDAGHIKNAINIFADDFDTYKNRLKNIPKDEPVVTYCGGTDCDLSIVLGNKLSKMGYEKIFIFFGGWNEWLIAKQPVEKP